MADDADRAAEQQEMLLAAALARRAQAGPVATGYCLHCGEPLAPNLRWCDADCRDDWQRSSYRHAPPRL